MVEVLDYAPTTLTHREKLLLVVLAEDARDATRRTWNSIEDAKILRRAKVSRSQLYEIVKSLIAKDVLKKEQAGQKNGTAKYVLLPLGPQCPEIPDTEPDQCPETPDTETTSQSPENRDTDGSQCPENRDVSVPESGTPTPHPLSSLSPQSDSAPRKPPAAPSDEREKISTTDTDTIVAAYLNTLGRPLSTTTRSKLHAQAAQLLADGFPAWWLADRARELADRGWTDLAQHCDRSTVPTVRKATATSADWCGQCDDPNYRQIRDPARDNELADCPACHPAALARARRATEGAAA